MKHLILCFVLLCLCVFLSSSAFAQWPTSAAENLLICDHNGEQAVPKITATSDGGCYIAWYDLASGNYDVYLQRLNADGVPQWTHPCGLLISNHPQETWITDWDMTVDLEDHCIITVNDIRAGGDWDIYGYRISPAGDFVWGPDGIALSDNANFEATPIVTVTSGGNIAFAWLEDTPEGSVVNLRKLTIAGTDVFTAGTITLNGGFGVSIPRMAAGENDELLLQYRVSQGPDWWSPRYVYMQKYDSLGNELWVEDGAAIMTTNGIGVQMLPDLVYDGEGGAYSFWYDTRNNIHHVYVQHANNSGAIQWTENGVQVDLSESELQMAPVSTRVPGGAVLFYQATNASQSLGGVQAQKISIDGVREWGEGGIVLIPFSNAPALYLSALQQTGNPVLVYAQYVPGSAINTLVRAIKIDSFDGSIIWDPSPRDLCSVASAKSHLNVCVTPLNQIIAVWPDSRSAVDDIYLQNINPDGTLGSYVALPPSITVLSPQDADIVHTNQVTVVCEVEGFTVAPFPEGDGIVYVYQNGETMAVLEHVEPFTLTVEEGGTEIILELLNHDLQSLNPPAADTIHVTYAPPSIIITSPAQDTTVFSAESIEIFYDVQNFAVSETGDGCIFFDVWLMDPPADTTFLSQSVHCVDEPIEYFFGTATPESDYIMCLTLMDYRTDPMTPVASDTVIVTYDDFVPSITITSPPQDTLFINDDSMSVDYEIQNFDVAEFGGDGWIDALVWHEGFTGDTMTLLHTSHYNLISIDVSFGGGYNGFYYVILALVDNDGEPLIPPMADTLMVEWTHTAADETPSGIPSEFALHPAYPNPFNPETTIRYDVQSTSHVLLTVHDLLGRTIATLADDTRDAGSYSVMWSGRNDSGEAASSGVYFVRMSSGSFTAAQKLILIR